MDPVQDGRERRSAKTQSEEAASQGAAEATAAEESAEAKKKGIKYKLDSRIVRAHRDYAKWLELDDDERDKLGIQGDVLLHFFRKYKVP